MGRGKTSAAEAYMLSSRSKRFLYITPYLSEVDRICVGCDFDQPDSDRAAKSTMLKHLLRHKDNIACTHSLFYLIDNEALDLIRSGNYSIIIDEAIETVRKVQVTSKDYEMIVNSLASVDDGGYVHWIDEEYEGKFSGYKDMADAGCLISMDSAFLYIMNPEVLSAFDEVIMMTYLFDGQYQKAYLDYFDMEYDVCGVDTSSGGFCFTSSPDEPPLMNYRELIHIIDDDSLNGIGSKKYSLSKKWYERRSESDEDIRVLKKNLRTFIRKYSSGSTDTIWTCFKSQRDKLIGDHGRYASSYVQPTARATNSYRGRTAVAYLVNRFIDPNVSKFFGMSGIDIDQDVFALSEMLQFVWRSAIRDGREINLYVPSKRMRDLLTDWINKNSTGGVAGEE